MAENNKQNLNITEEEVREIVENAIKQVGEEGAMADDIVINFGCGKEAN